MVSVSENPTNHVAGDFRSDITLTMRIEQEVPFLPTGLTIVSGEELPRKNSAYLFVSCQIKYENKSIPFIPIGKS
jgi:hypothetical protein